MQPTYYLLYIFGLLDLFHPFELSLIKCLVKVFHSLRYLISDFVFSVQRIVWVVVCYETLVVNAIFLGFRLLFGLIDASYPVLGNGSVWKFLRCGYEFVWGYERDGSQVCEGSLFKNPWCRSKTC